MSFRRKTLCMDYGPLFRDEDLPGYTGMLDETYPVAMRDYFVDEREQSATDPALLDGVRQARPKPYRGWPYRS